MKKINLAMLSMDEPSSPEAVNLDDDLPSITNQVEDGLDDLKIAMQDLETIDQAIAEAVDASIELKVEQEVVQQAQQEGQVSQAALESIQRNVNRMLKDVGFDTQATFALESYNNPHYNKVALESALESIKAFIARIWQAIKDAFEKTKNMVKEILKKYFDLSVKTKARAQAIKKKAESLKGEVAPSDTKVGSSSLSNYMRHSNKALEPSVLVAGIDKWTAWSHNVIEGIAGKDAIDEYTQYVDQAGKLLVDALSHQNKDKLQAQADALGKNMLKRIYKNLPKVNGTKHGTEVLLGDVRYVFDDKDMGFEVARVDDYKEISTDRSHDLLSVDQVIILCDKINAHMDTYKKIDEYINSLDKLEDSIDKLSSEAIKSNAEVDYVQSKVLTKLSSFTIKIFIDAIRKVGIGARAHDMQVDKATMDWCELSLRPL
jgi:hypothetical protein